MCMSSCRSGGLKSEGFIKGVACCFNPSQASPFAPRGHANARAESEVVGATCSVAYNARLICLCEKFSLRSQEGF